MDQRHILNAISRECARRLYETRHTVEKEARAAASIDNLAWLKIDRAEVEHHEQGQRNEYWRFFGLWFGHAQKDSEEREIHDQIGEAVLYRAGQVAFLLVEVIAGAVLAAIYFNTGTLISMVIGSFLALLMAAASAAIDARWVRNDASVQPSKMMDRVTRGLVGLGATWLVACVTALAMLRSQDAPGASYLCWVATTVVTLVSPVCSGLCGVAADLLLWSRRICNSLNSIRSLSRELDQLREISERSLPPELPPRVAQATLPTPVDRPPKVAALIIAMLFGSLSISRAAELPVYVYADVSPSARAGNVTNVLSDFSNRLSQYDNNTPLVISLIPFFEEAFTAKPTLRLTIQGATTCPTPKSELVHISKTYSEANARECANLRTQERSQAIGKLSAAIDALRGLKLPGRCTAVNAMMLRAGQESPNGVSLLVSDMQNSCDASPPLPERWDPSNRVFVIPVGSRQHSIETAFDGIRARYSRMPGVQVIEPFRVNEVIEAISHHEARVAANH